jgi:hypothetical protein
MSKFIIEPHFRLQEWVAEEKGYFLAEGLEYEFRELIRSTDGQHHNKVSEGAFQSIEKGREADVSCACHWTVNVAASNGHPTLCRRVFGRSFRNFLKARPPLFERRPISQTSHFGWIPVGQPLFDDSGARTVHAAE